MTGPAGVVALVLAETVAGAATWLFLSPLWGEVKRGFFKLTGVVLLILSLAGWRSVAAGLTASSDAGRWGLWLSAAVAASMLVWILLLYARADRAARIVGFVSVALCVGMLVALAGTAEGSAGVAALQLLAGAAFLGSTLDGLLLGHWYLTDRGLSRQPIDRSTIALIVAVVLEALAIILGGFGPTGASNEFNPLLTTAGLASWIALGMTGATALIAVMIRLTLKGARATAVQAATGFFYLAVITALTAELAAKVRFLPPR
ncbi:MAG: hypothetical protein ACJ76P_00315 [Actinomycetota bacterium]